jgi:hypothetical protein
VGVIDHDGAGATIAARRIFIEDLHEVRQPKLGRSTTAASVGGQAERGLGLGGH